MKAITNKIIYFQNINCLLLFKNIIFVNRSYEKSVIYWK